jgi:hypothetical protein
MNKIPFGIRRCSYKYNRVLFLLKPSEIIARPAAKKAA